MRPGPRILVVGGGAIGAYVAAGLIRAGHDVTVLDPWTENVAAIRSRGLRVEGLTAPECFSVPARAISPGEVAGLASKPPYAVALLALKSYDTGWGVRLALPLLETNAPIVSLQNGLNEDEIAAIVGSARTVGCVVARISAEMPEPGLAIRTTPLGGAEYVSFRVGEYLRPATARTRELAALLEQIDSAGVTDDLAGERWSKLAVNAMRNGLSAATGLSGNDRDGEPLPRRISLALGAEAVRVARRLGHALSDIAGIAPDDLLRAELGDAESLAKCEGVLIETAERRSDRQRPSMAQDLAKGRRTEHEAITGRVLAAADETGEPVPVTRALHELMMALCAGRERPGRAHLGALARAQPVSPPPVRARVG